MAVLGALPLLALTLPGTAEATATALASPTPTCANPPLCVLPTPTLTPSRTPTPSPTPSRSARPASTPSPTPRHTRSPRPRSTFSAAPGSTEHPVTGTVNVGRVRPQSPSPTATPKDSSSYSNPGDTITRVVYLVLGGAVLLGLGGATGLYLTRHRHEQ